MVPLRVLTPVGATGLIAVDKPAGQLVIPGREASAEPCVRQQLEQQLGRPVWVVHRLDRETSGVLVFALDADSHREASMAFEHDQVRKQYLALVEGRITAPQTIDLALVPARKGRMRPVHPGEEGKAASTRVTPLEVFGSMTWVRAEPTSGRQHQIRVHLKAIGHSLVFDHQYGRKVLFTERELAPMHGGPAVVLNRTPLHAAQLSIPSLQFEAHAEVPADLQRCLELLRASQSAVTR